MLLEFGNICLPVDALSRQFIVDLRDQEILDSYEKKYSQPVCWRIFCRSEVKEYNIQCNIM